MKQFVFLLFLTSSCITSNESYNQEDQHASAGHVSSTPISSTRNLLDYTSIELDDVLTDRSDIRSVKFENESGTHSMILSMEELSELKEVFIARGGEKQNFIITITKIDGSKVVQSYTK